METVRLKIERLRAAFKARSARAAFDAQRWCARLLMAALARVVRRAESWIVRLHRYDYERPDVIAAVARGGSSEEFGRMCALRDGAEPKPMTLEHGVTHNADHGAFALEPAISSEPLSKAEIEAMARALSGGSTEHVR